MKPGPLSHEQSCYSFLTKYTNEHKTTLHQYLIIFHLPAKTCGTFFQIFLRKVFFFSKLSWIEIGPEFCEYTFTPVYIFFLTLSDVTLLQRAVVAGHKQDVPSQVWDRQTDRQTDNRRMATFHTTHWHDPRPPPPTTPTSIVSLFGSYVTVTLSATVVHHVFLWRRPKVHITTLLLQKRVHAAETFTEIVLSCFYLL